MKKQKTYTTVTVYFEACTESDSGVGIYTLEDCEKMPSRWKLQKNIKKTASLFCINDKPVQKYRIITKEEYTKRNKAAASRIIIEADRSGVAVTMKNTKEDV